MAITQEITRTQFTDILLADEYASWSYKGAHALYDWLYDLSDGMGEDIDLDHVALRCEWSESNIDDLAEQYSNLKEDDETPLEFAERMEQERTTIIWIDQTNIIYGAF